MKFGLKIYVCVLCKYLYQNLSQDDIQVWPENISIKTSKIQVYLNGWTIKTGYFYYDSKEVFECVNYYSNGKRIVMLKNNVSLFYLTPKRLS